MSTNYFLSDPHFGHQNIPKFRPCFSTVEEHDQHIFDNCDKLFRKQDKIWFNGDVAFTKEALYRIKELKGTKILILGNHDTEWKKRGYTLKDLMETFNDIQGFVKWHEFWLSHCPIAEVELRGKINIHGHIHSHIIDDPRYVNICMEHINYTPITLEEIRAIVASRNITND